jgi:multicomponent Na+:H+ antiporter subunit F
MNAIYLAVSVFLLFTLAVGLVRVLRGPAPADRMLATQLLGTTGVAILLLLAEVQSESALRDAALLLAMLAVLVVVAFVRRTSTHTGKRARNRRRRA